jgi:hypothetical protein
VLFAAYAATLGVDAGRGGARHAGAETAYLRAADRLAGGDGLDRADPHGAGFPALLVPAHAVGGATAVELLLAAVAALAFVLGAALARRVVPDPWATWAALLAGLSPPALAHATAVTPALTAGALLAGAVLCALAVRERPSMRFAFGGAALLAVLPWLDPWLLVPALPVALLLARWTARRGRSLVALGTAEVQLASLVFYVSLNDRLYGGFTPLAVADDPVTGTSGLDGYAGRLPRLATLWVQREVGLLRWAPVLLLAFLGAWLLWRSRRERLGRLVAERRDAEHAAFLALAVCAAQVMVAVFALPRLGGMPGAALAVGLPCAVPLVAWGLRHAPRAGLVLGVLTLVGSVWLVAAGGPWAAPASDAPWGPLVAAFPRGDRAAVLVAAAIGAAALGALEWRRRRELRP